MKKKKKKKKISSFLKTKNVFYPFRDKFQLLSHSYFAICKSFQFGLSLKFCRLVKS